MKPDQNRGRRAGAPGKGRRFETSSHDGVRASVVWTEQKNRSSWTPTRSLTTKPGRNPQSPAAPGQAARSARVKADEVTALVAVQARKPEPAPTRSAATSGTELR